MLNHLGKINITAPIKSSADLRLAAMTQQRTDIHNVKHKHYSSTSHCCNCNRKQLMPAPIRQPSQQKMGTIHEMYVQGDN
jgi:hypothetical protein